MNRWDEQGRRPHQSSGRSQAGEAPRASAKTDYRTHARYDVELEIGLGWNESNFYMGLTENVSEGGLFIATHQVRPIGSVIEVSLKLPDCAEPIQTTAVVRWVRVYSKSSDGNPGMGVQFRELAPKHLEAIRRFLARHTPLFYEE